MRAMSPAGCVGREWRVGAGTRVRGQGDRRVRTCSGSLPLPVLILARQLRFSAHASPGGAATAAVMGHGDGRHRRPADPSGPGVAAALPVASGMRGSPNFAKNNLPPL